jgi:hypothetical protein
MLSEFHDAVFALVDGGTNAAVWDHIPDDINELPCVVVGNPLARQTTTRVVFDMGCELFVIGKRSYADGTQAELRALADELWLLFNGTRVTSQDGVLLQVRNLLPRTLQIAGLDCPAYSLTVESSIATC